jgi:hypothetical protein
MSDTVEKKKIPDADLDVIRNMDKHLENLMKMHHKIRKDFLRAESVLLREQGVAERELKTFVVGLYKSLKIEEEDLMNWKLDLEEGVLFQTKELAPEPEPEIFVPEPELEPKTPSKEEQVLADIRQKYSVRK